MKIKKFFPEKIRPETRTTLSEQVSYIWITLRELVRFLKPCKKVNISEEPPKGANTIPSETSKRSSIERQRG